MVAETNGKLTSNRITGFVDPLLLNTVMDNFTARLSRDFAAQNLDPRRDIFQECGWPPLGDTILPEAYRDLYERNSYAKRVVDLMPKECWQGEPAIYEKEDTEDLTDFEEAWFNLGASMTPGGKSWFNKEKGNPLFHYLMRLDILSGIGQFGVMLMGFDDGKNLQDPCEGIQVLMNRRKGKLSVNAKYRPKVWLDSPMSKEEIKKRDEDVAAGLYPDVWNRAAKAKNDEVIREFTTNGLDPVTNDGAPGDGPYVQGMGPIRGTDKQYSWQQGLNLPPPESGMALSGTDQQYFGIQFGPSETYADKPAKGPRKLLFLRVFDESLVQVVRYEWNVRNPRFGLPVMYRITLNDPRQPSSGVGLPLATVYVHWSRVIHVPSDEMVVSEIFGMPRMKPVINNLMDIQKVLGGGAEGYWRSCTPIISLETHPSLGGDVLIDKESLQLMMFKIFNSLQREMITSGMTAKTVAPTVTDPTSQVDKQVEAICVVKGCPVRVFKGAERGELASSQDDESWNERKAERQSTFITPKIIVPFVDRLIQTGCLPEPEEFGVRWPDLDILGEKDKAAIAQQKTAALAAYVSGNCESLVKPVDYLTDFLYIDNERAQEMIDEAEDAQKDTMTMPPEGDPGHPAAKTPKPPPMPPGMGGPPGAGGKPGGPPNGKGAGAVPPAGPAQGKAPTPGQPNSPAGDKAAK